MNQPKPLRFRRYCDGDASVLAQIRADAAAQAGLDSESTLGLPPTEDQLQAGGTNADEQRFVVAELDGTAVGYSTMSDWRESSGVWVFLIDGHVAPAALGCGVATALLDHMESIATSLAKSKGVENDAVFAGNASVTEEERTTLLSNNGYSMVFSMVGMKLDDLSTVSPTPIEGFEIATARPDELRQIWELDELVYKGRPFTTPATESSFDNFRERSGSDLGLWFVARDGDNVIAFVSSRKRGSYAEIMDVTVHPDYRRRGLARALLTSNLAELHQQGFESARLHTNGEDVSGALSLYSSLGFEICERRLRFRKAMGNTTRLS